MEPRSLERIRHIRNHLVPCEESVASLLPNFTSAQFPNGILAKQVAIITGSGQGIGEQTALLFAKEGAHVVVTDLDAGDGQIHWFSFFFEGCCSMNKTNKISEKSNRVAEAIRRNGGSAISVPGDITNPTFPEKLVEETIKAFGKLNIIVNNAGYLFFFFHSFFPLFFYLLSFSVNVLDL
jgi:3-oxoacyl-[acyl-carrier protein] reductase